jgi:hypothetical protein
MVFKKLLLFSLITIASFSCKFKEDTIIPFAEPQTISEIQQAILLATNGKDFQASSMSYYQVEGDSEHFYLKLRYNADRITSQDLERANSDISHMSRSLMGLFAKIFFKLGGEYDVDIPAISFELPTMEYDKDIIVDVNISKIHLEFLKPSKANNFKFIEHLELLTPSKENGGDKLLLGYKKNNNKCNFKCMELDLYETSIIDIIGDKKIFTVKTDLKINKLPKKIDLKFKGYVEIFVKLKLPF